MLSNYPPGVTGNEYQIAGPDWEQEDHRYCPECGYEVDGTTEGYRGEVLFFHDLPDSQHCVDLTDEFNERPSVDS